MEEAQRYAVTHGLLKETGMHGCGDPYDRRYGSLYLKHAETYLGCIGHLAFLHV